MEKYLIDKTAEFDAADIDKNKIVCGISFIAFLFFLPLVACKESAYGRFMANQALITFLLGIVINIVPVIGTLAGAVVFWYMIINAFMGKAKCVPFIGDKITIIK